MKILIVHNHYQAAGGEDEVVASEKHMLERNGHKVILYTRSNKDIDQFSFPAKVSFVLKEAYWSRATYQALQALIHHEKPDIAHIHNTFLLVSPSVYDACRDENLPVVQTLHNYRFLCPNGVFYRDGHVCEDCLHQGLASAVVHKCWKDSYLSSGVMVRIIHEMKRREIFTKKINHYIALTEFSKKKFVDNGFPENKISIKPNFLGQDPGLSPAPGTFGLFVGALRDYKGIEPLVKAWEGVEDPFSLKIIGDGPLRQVLETRSQKRIEWLGAKPLAESLSLMKESLFVVVPSQCYETFSRVTMEAFACGKPVIAPRRGVFNELIENGKTGLLFDPQVQGDLTSKMNQLVLNRPWAQQMGQRARRVYEERFTVEKNYKMLMFIYERAKTLGYVG